MLLQHTIEFIDSSSVTINLINSMTSTNADPTAYDANPAVVVAGAEYSVESSSPIVTSTPPVLLEGMNYNYDTNATNVVLENFSAILTDQLKELCRKMRKKPSEDGEVREEKDEGETLKVEGFSLRKRPGKAVTEKVSAFTFNIPADHKIFEEMGKAEPKTRAEAEQRKQRWVPFPDRLTGWVVERRGRKRNQVIQCDMYYHHKASGGQFKSKVELINFVINNVHPVYSRSNKKVKAITLGGSSTGSTPPKKRGRKPKNPLSTDQSSSASTSSSTAAKSAGKKRKVEETQLASAGITQEDIDAANTVIALNQRARLSHAPTAVAANNIKDGGSADDDEKVGMGVQNGKEEEQEVVIIDLTGEEEHDHGQHENTNAPDPVLPEIKGEEEGEAQVVGGAGAGGAVVFVGDGGGDPPLVGSTLSEIAVADYLDAFGNLDSSFAPADTFMDAFGNLDSSFAPVDASGVQGGVSSSSNTHVSPLDASNFVLGEGITTWTEDYNYFRHDFDYNHVLRKEEAMGIEQSIATLSGAGDSRAGKADGHDQGGGNVNVGSGGFNGAPPAWDDQGGLLGWNFSPNSNYVDLLADLRAAGLLDDDLPPPPPSFGGIGDVVAQGLQMGSSSRRQGSSQSDQDKVD